MQTASLDVPHVCESCARCTTAASAEGRRRRPPPRRPGARPAAPETASPRGFHAFSLPLIHLEYLCIFGVVAPEDQHPGTSKPLRFAAPKGLVFFIS